MLTSNTILQNRYRVVRQLGQGGMGTVYEAIDERVSCVVAVKETLPTSDADARRAFEREASLLANLRHPLLPKVMDHFTDEQGQFLVMEFIHGYDLAELLDVRGAAFPPAQVIAWADELLKVLEYLHGRQPPILHRDIKPSNLKLTKQGEIFVLDFGLAKGAAGQMAAVMTSRSVRGYTPVYAPLEQIHGKGTDQRSDLYSLGATLYHLLTGTQPTDAPSRFVDLEDDRPDPLRPIDEINPQVSPAIAAIIHKAMAVSRKHRYANAAEMRTALREAKEETDRHEIVNRLVKHDEERNQAPEAKPVDLEAEPAAGVSDKERIEQLKAEARRLQDQRRRQKMEEDSRRRQDLTRASDSGTHPTIQSSEVKAPVEPPSMKTLKAPPAQIYQSADVLSSSSPGILDDGDGNTNNPGTRMLMIAAASIVGVILLVTLGWMLFSGNDAADDGSKKANDGQQQTNQATPPAGMAYVPGGTFMLGRNDGDDYERPSHSVTVKPFFVDIYEVTEEEYAKFATATKGSYSYKGTSPRRPMTGVNWDDANAFAKWAGKRLPTEEEWELAARGSDGRRYPWGNEWNSGIANAGGTYGGMADVGTFKGASPYGAFDMVGNAWEWTTSKLIAYPGGTLPIKTSDDLKVIRGGTFSSNQNQATTTYRRGWRATGESDYGNTGFRCIKDIPGSQ